MSFSMEETGRFSVASLITRSTNDIMQVQMLIVMGLQMLIKAPIMASWAIIKIAGKQSEWLISTALSVGVLLLIVAVCLFLAIPKFKKMH
jgi:ATP-binding cassette subfamily B protein